MVGVQSHGTALADAAVDALPGWVERSVARLVTAWTGAPPDPTVQEMAREAGRRAAVEVGGELRALVEADVDDQHATPLSLLRRATRYPTEVLRASGVPPVERDAIQERLLPDDVYDLAPATFADVDPALAEPGMLWGAAKALAHRRRHQPMTQPRIVAYVPDLMDRSKVAAAGAVTFVARPADLAGASEDADVVVVDLTRPGVVDALAGLGDRRVIGFANHTSRDVMAAARAAGAEQVLARSEFFARLDELLG